MPAKKKVTAEAAEEMIDTAVEETPAKKTTRRRTKKADADTAAEETSAKKTRKSAKKTTDETVVEEAPVKKTRKSTKKKADETAEEKPAKKTRRSTKKTAALEEASAAAVTPAAEETPVPETDHRSVQDYEDIINWKKGEAHASDWLYIEINAGDLLTEVEAGADNLKSAVQGMLNTMLEGDGFINDPGEDKVNEALTVRYYTDNLSADRKKYFEA